MKIGRWCRFGGLQGLVLAALVGCGSAAEPEAIAPVPLVTVMTVVPTRMELSEDLPGRVAPVRIAEIRPQVSGIVRRRLFEQGADVHAGQPLFEIDSSPFRAEEETAAASLQRAEAALARRRLDLKFATVESPIAGRIEQALVTEGALVASSDSTPMARVQQIEQVYVDVRQPASSLVALHETMAAQPLRQGGLPVSILRSDGSPYDVTGRVLFSGISVDPGTGDLLLRVLVENPRKRLLPGMFLRVRVPLSSYPDALAVPQQAVIRIHGKPHIWTVDDDAKAHLVAVTLGELVDRRYRVASGLRADQKVVIAGMERLAEGVVVDLQAQQEPAPVTPAASAN